jgi:arylsulfatase A-like enzyme
MWGMGDHSRPLHTYDETAHIPMIYRHPTAIPAGEQLDLMVSHYDFLPTVLNYLGYENKIPDNPELPGRDYSAVLRGQQIEWDNLIYYEFENCRMIRRLDWKYTRRFPAGPDELYDLKNDPGERKNLTDDSEYDEIQKHLYKQLSDFFDYYADPKYDLWRGGGSKSILLTFSNRIEAV